MTENIANKSHAEQVEETIGKLMEIKAFHKKKPDRQILHCHGSPAAIGDLNELIDTPQHEWKDRLTAMDCEMFAGIRDYIAECHANIVPASRVRALVNTMDSVSDLLRQQKPLYGYPKSVAGATRDNVATLDPDDFAIVEKFIRKWQDDLIRQTKGTPQAQQVDA